MQCHAPEGGTCSLTAGVGGVKDNVLAFVTGPPLSPHLKHAHREAERGHPGVRTATASTYHLQPNVGG